jgi:hypothetical protein
MTVADQRSLRPASLDPRGLLDSLMSGGKLRVDQK